MADKNVKFTEEEMKKISDLQSGYLNIQNTLGQLSVSRIRLEQQLTDLNSTESNVISEFSKTQEREKDFVSSINKKYGDGNLDINSGVFTPRPTEETPDKTL